MTNEQLLDELRNRKLIDQEVAAKVKRDSLMTGRGVEELLYERQAVDDAKVAQVVGDLLGIPYFEIRAAALPDELLEIIPEGTVRSYGVVPLAKEGDTLVVGMLHPDDLKAQETLKFIAHRHRLNLGVYVISYSGWQEVLKKYSPYKSEIAAAVRALNLKPSGALGRLVRLDGASEKSEEAPIITIVSDTLKEAVQRRASDVHIEPQENYLRVRFRVDGNLEEISSLPLELGQPIVSRIKVISNLKIDETRIPQDGRFRTKLFEREIDFRVSTYPTPLGEKVAIRVLDPTTGLKTLDQLGLVGRNWKVVHEGLNRPFGMIVMSGPTGSGKTTTLYALLQLLNKGSVNIVSLEDPVEYFVAGVNQSQVRPEIGYDFASGLRQILRQDPDIIMVGEIRDNETAGLAMQAALTGHIVLSTLHTNNAISVIPRLLDMKVESFLLPVSVNLMISQRLLGVLCPDCKTSKEAPQAVAKLIARALTELPEDVSRGYKEPFTVYRGSGCGKCRGRGVVGRTAIYEVLQMTPELEEIITAGPTLAKIAKEAQRQGMITLREDGVLKALQGMVAIEEVLRSTEEM